MRARLYSVTDLSQRRPPLILDRFPVFLGVSENGKLHASELSVPVRHCQLRIQLGTLVIEDLDSPEGTWVNGDSVKRAPLLPGDHLQIGDCELVVSYERLTRQIPPDATFRTVPQELEATSPRK